MRKRIISIILIIMILVTTGCRKNADNANSTPTESPNCLEGYYVSNHVDGARFKFEITDIASGDYGGEVTNMEKTDAIFSYYVIGDEVYIDGELAYYFVDSYLARISSATRLRLSGSNGITGTYENVYITPYDGSRSMEYKFAEDGTVQVTRFVKSREVKSWKATHTIDDSIVTISGNNETKELFIIYNDVIYPILVRV